MEEIDRYLQQYVTLVNERLAELFSEEELVEKELNEAARYSLFAGGKRLRPLLTLSTAEALGTSPEKALTAACALELVHTYSLIHDDLPCMDDDDLRRGKPTLHKAFNEATAVLAGDYLLTYSFEVIASDKELTETQKIRLITILAQAAGGGGMIGGQLLDMKAEGEQLPLERLATIHRFKTGAMISASVAFGAVIAGAEGKVLEQLAQFGYDIGLAFQIVDDLLDVTQTEELLGKTANSDLVNDKSTYVSLLGIEGAKRAAAELLGSALERLEALPLRGDRLKELALYLVERKR